MGLLELGGRTFAQRTIEALRGGGCEEVLFVVDAEDHALCAHVAGESAVVLANPAPGEGPITSLRMALQTLSGDIDAVVYLPLDHALVEARHVERLIDEAVRSDAPLALPVHEGKRGHPAFFSQRLFAELLDPGLEGGARTVVHRHLAQACLFEAGAAVVADIDTQEAYKEAIAHFEAVSMGSDAS